MQRLASFAGRFLFGKVRNVPQTRLIDELDAEEVETDVVPSFEEYGTNADNLIDDHFEEAHSDIEETGTPPSGADEENTDAIPLPVDENIKLLSLKAYDTDEDDRFEEALSDIEKTCPKDVYTFGNAETVTSTSAFQFPPAKALDFDSLFVDNEKTVLLEQTETKNVFSACGSGLVGQHCDGTSARQKGKSPRENKKAKREPKKGQQKRKRREDDGSLSSESDVQEHTKLLNIQKYSRGPESTSDYMSQVSEEPDAEAAWLPFRRNNGSRQSKLYKCNSVVGLTGVGRENRRLLDQGSPISPPSQVTVKHINQAIFSAGSGDVKESTIVSVNSTEWDIISDRVKDQTVNTLETHRNNGPIVETEGYLGVKKLIHDVTKRNKPVIVLGHGDGAWTIVKQVLLELCSAPTTADENQSVSDDPESRDWDEYSVCPYVIHDPTDWVAVDKDQCSSSKSAVIAVPDPGKILKNLTLLNEHLRRIEQCQLASRDVTALVAMTKFPDFDDKEIKERYGDNVVDLQSPEYIISEESKRNLFENFMEKNQISYTSEARWKQQAPGNAQSISPDTATEIIRQADRRGFVKAMVQFFRDDLTEGVAAFTKPDITMVKQIREMVETNDPAFYALLAVYDYGGELSTERVEQIRRTLMTNKPSWSVLDMLKTNDVRGHNYRPPIPKQSLAMKFAKTNKCLDQLGDILQDGMEQQNQRLLEEENHIYRFRSGKVRTSLLLVLAYLFPKETLLSCEDSFVTKYVCPRSAGRGRPNELYIAIESNKNYDIKKAMIKRITQDVQQRKVSMYTNHPLFKESWFVDELFSYWKEKNLLWNILEQTESSAFEPYCLLYFGLDQTFTDKSKDGANNVAEKVLQRKLWKDKRRPHSYSSKSQKEEFKWVHGQEHGTMMRAIELDRHTTVKLLTQMNLKVTEEMMRLAIKQGRTKVIKIFKEVGVFTDVEWWNALLYSFEVFCQAEASQSAKDVFEELTEKASSTCTDGTVQPLVHFAVANNDKKMTQLLCSLSREKVTVNIISSDGDTALNIATRNGNESIVRILLDAGAKQINQGNVTKLPIHEAAETGNINLLKMLVLDTPAVLNIKDLDGKSPLHLATENGHILAVKELLGMENIQVSIQDSIKQSALHVAAKLGHEYIVQMLLEKNADTTLYDSHKETALSLAGAHSKYVCAGEILKVQEAKQSKKEILLLMKVIKESDFTMLKLLMRYGYSLNTYDKRFGSPLLVAILHNMHKMVKFLLENGADVHQVVGSRHPILWAAMKGDTEMFQLLRNFGADIGEIDTSTWDSVVHFVVKADHEDLVVNILSLPESASLVDMKNINGDTAVHVACRDGNNVKILEQLLSANFSKSQRNRNSDDPDMIVEMRRNKALKENETAVWRYCYKVSKALKTV